MYNRYLLLFIVTLLTISTVSATEDVLLGSDAKDISLCGCSNINNTILIKNTGDVVTSYVLSAEGSGARFSSLRNPLSLTLQPGQKLRLINNINPICGIQGDYDLYIRVKSDNVDKVISQTLSVDKCSNVGIELDKYEKTINPCDKTTYEITLTNTGFHNEQYSFDIEPLYSHQFTANNIELRARHKAILYLNLEPCFDYGEEDITLITKTLNSKLTASTPLKINTIEPYLFSTEEKSFCETDEIRVPIRIKNLATKDKTFTLSIEENNFTNLEETTATISPNQLSITQLTVTPSIDSVGEHNLSLKIINNNIESTEYIPFEIKQCSSIELTSADVEEVICEKTEYNVDITNNGNLTEDISFSVLGSDYATLSHEALTIAPGEDDSIKLTVEPTKSEETTITVKAELKNGLVKEQTFQLSTKNKNECYNAKLSAKNFKSGQQGELKITNKGFKQATYELSINSDDVTIEPSQITLNSEESGTVNIIPKEEIAGLSKITITATSNEQTYTTSVKIGESIIIKNTKHFAKKAVLFGLSKVKQYILYVAAGIVGLIILLFIILKALSSEHVTPLKTITTLILLAAIGAVYYYWKTISPHFWLYINYVIGGFSALIILIIILTLIGRGRKPEDKEDKKEKEEPEPEELIEKKVETKKEPKKEVKNNEETPAMFQEKDAEEIELFPEFEDLSGIKYVVLALIILGAVLFLFSSALIPLLVAYWKFIALGIFVLLLIITVLNQLSEKSSRISKYILTILIIVAVISFMYVKNPAAGHLLSQTLENVKFNLGHIPEWTSLYLNYIIIGVIILIIIILFLRLSNEDNLNGENNKKKTTSKISKKTVSKKTKKKPAKRKKSRKR